MAFYFCHTEISNKMKLLSRITTFLIVLMASSITAMAGDVTPEQAKQKAASFLYTNNDATDGTGYGRSRIPASSMRVTDASKSIYAVNVNNGGFVLVAKTDALEDVLGYCDSGEFDSGDIPENFLSMLSDLEQEVAAIASGTSVQYSPRKASRKSISPMIKSKWNQGEVSATGNVYNCKCPTVTLSNGKTYYCVTGCVATAMAQLMYYYKYPSSTKKSIPSFTSNSTIGTLSSLSTTTFDWGSMQNEYTGTDLTNLSSYKAMPISKLMQYCGYSVKMSYGTGGSFANAYYVVGAMVDYFGFNSNAYLADRENYTIDDWNTLIYNELTASRPVLYSGSSTGGGHQFLIDGIDGSGRYHVNWGWGGKYDGYYSINLLNPKSTSAGSSSTSDGYTYDQMAIIGMQPTTTGVLTGVSVISASNSGSNLLFNILNRTNASCSYYLGIGTISSSGSVSKVLTSGSSRTTLDVGYGLYDYGISQSGLALRLGNGTHKISAIYSSNNSTWYPCVGANKYYAEVVVSGGSTKSITINPGECKVTATSARLTGNGYANSQQEVEVTFKNNVAKEYTGTVGMYVNGSLTTTSGLYLNGSGSDKAYFYFTPASSGYSTVQFYEIDPYSHSQLTYLGQASLRITEGPIGKVEASISCPTASTYGGNHYVYDTFATIDVSMYNNTRSTTTGYILLSRSDLSYYTYWQPNVNPYERKILEKDYSDLVKGKTYTFYVYYSPTTKISSGTLLDSYKLTVYDSSVIIKGDVNRDGRVDITDVVCIVSTISGKNTYRSTSDVNGDKRIDITDVVEVINIISK